MKAISIKEIQKINYEIIKYVDCICKKEGIDYFLAYGSLLGAIREAGFISWDDDMDIWMKREDYEKFADVIHKYPDERFFFQNNITDPLFPVPELARVCVNGTLDWDRTRSNLTFHKGIYFDIFPLDFSSEKPNYVTRKMKKLRILHMLAYAYATDYQASKTLKGFAYRLLLNILPYETILNLINRIIHENKNEDRSELVSFACQYPLEKGVFESKWFDDVVYKKFEDLYLPCPNNYDLVLKTIYGDNYMTPIKTKSSEKHAYSL